MGGNGDIWLGGEKTVAATAFLRDGMPRRFPNPKKGNAHGGPVLCQVL